MDQPIYVRLPPQLLERVDAEADRLRRESPGLRATRSDAVRLLILRALGGDR